MPLYRYKAVNTSGDVADGELEAANESEIVDRLRDQGLMPMQVVAAARPGAVQRPAERRSWFAPRHVTRNQMLAFRRELATLLRAGLPLDRALVMRHAIATELKAQAMKEGMVTMYEDGMRKALGGVTTFEEVLRVTRED